MSRPIKNKKPSRALEPVGSVSKAFDVLRAFVDGQNQWGVRELAPVLDLPRSTVHRMLLRLRADGILRYDENRKKYELGFEFFRLSAAGQQRDEFTRAARIALRELVAASSEAAWFARFDADRLSVACVAEEISSQIGANAPIAREQSLTESAIGLAVLAFLDKAGTASAMASHSAKSAQDLLSIIERVRSQGYATSTDRDSGATILAAPVEGPGHRFVGSLAVVIPRHRLGEANLSVLSGLLLAATKRLSNRLGVRILGGSRTGTWHDAMATISALLHRHDPELSLVPALGGGSRNLEDLERGLASYALTTAGSLYEATQGKGPFGRPIRNLRTVMSLSELHLHIVLRPGVQFSNIPDFVGLRICPGEEGYSSARLFNEMLKSGRVARSRVEREGAIVYLDMPQAKRQLEAGAIDAFVWLAGAGGPFAKDLEAWKEFTLVSLPHHALAKLVESNRGYRIGTIDSGLYPGWLGLSLETLIDPTVLVCNEDRPVEEVHEVAKAVFEGRDQLALISSAYDCLDANFATRDPVVALHPGAERYFSE